jgi:ABC-type cobalamin/Fe3+-siderophores transport system ATPase subunit
MPVYLHGLSLQFYRGIGSETQWLGPFKNFNFFIGANNSGKSTVLDFLSRFLSAHEGRVAIEPLDRHNGIQSGETKVAYGIPLSQFLSNVKSTTDSKHWAHAAPLVEKIGKALAAERNMIWLLDQERG